jgi:hypothetical protein
MGLRISEKLKRFIRKFLQKAHSPVFHVRKRDFPLLKVYLNKGLKPRLFCLDAHISVIRDVRCGFSSFDVDIVHWNISGSKKYLGSAFNSPDPVREINFGSWKYLDESMRRRFQDTYGKFLSTFDGFISCHPLSFAQIYDPFKKPILAINSTRFEMPFSGNAESTDDLISFMRDRHLSGQLNIMPNNVGDLDYLKYFTGITGDYQPSLCDYNSRGWVGGGANLVLAKSHGLISSIQKFTKNNFIGLRENLGQNYSWDQLMRANSILVIPYNVSTMTLFEFATAGLPVIVPSRRFLKELRLQYEGVLSELSFFEIGKLDTVGFASDNPNNFRSSEYLDWWLDRADFFNSNLMPNVTVVESFEELTFSGRHHSKESLNGRLKDRNAAIFKCRETKYLNFLQKL